MAGVVAPAVKQTKVMHMTPKAAFVLTGEALVEAILSSFGKD